MATPALYVVEAYARAYKRIWKGSVVTAFVNPVLFLMAMGMGMGSLVDRSGAGQGLAGPGYIEFLAPGLLAATAMQTAASEASWPVMAGIKWRKGYHAMLATPVRVFDLVSGTLAWMAVRVLMSVAAFVVVMTLVGDVTIGNALSAIPASLLTGMAFGAPIAAFTAQCKNETQLSTLFRFIIMPMFLFSGTFFPVSFLPGWLEPVARATPLWHGVELARASALGLSEGGFWWHIGYLFAWAIAGFVVAQITFRRTLRQ